ncbi:MAG: DUF1189 domain-containing protein [Clostridia bacterium]|nr:DUF1189 domain-containing protein [Clostridia bacterium]
MENNKKISFLKKMFYAIKDFEKYQDFAIENKVIAIRYIMKLVFILVLVISICFMCKFTSIVKQGIRYFRNDFPNLYFANNELIVETDEPIIHEFTTEFEGIVIFDTSSIEEEKDYKDKLDLYQNGIVFAKDSFTVKNVNGVNTYSYSSVADLYEVQDFTKQDLDEYLTNKNVYSFYLAVFIIILLYLYVIYLITTIIDAIMLALLGFISSRISRIPLKFSVIYKMSLYALTLPIVLNIIYIIINSTTGFKVEYFDWMYTAISFIYLITAILMIKSDMMKQQMELLKIEEEQKRIREEQKRKEEEEREKQGQEKKEKDKEKNNNKKEGKGKQKPAPEGT